MYYVKYNFEFYNVLQKKISQKYFCGNAVPMRPHNTTACKLLYFKVNIQFQYFQIHLDGSTRHVHKCNQQLRDLQRLIRTMY